MEDGIPPGIFKAKVREGITSRTRPEITIKCRSRPERPIIPAVLTGYPQTETLSAGEENKLHSERIKESACGLRFAVDSIKIDARSEYTKRTICGGSRTTRGVRLLEDIQSKYSEDLYHRAPSVSQPENVYSLSRKEFCNPNENIHSLL